VIEWITMSRATTTKPSNSELIELLEDCYTTLEWITEQEQWDTLKEGSSARLIMSKIIIYQNKLNKYE
jgi:hypothetical protein